MRLSLFVAIGLLAVSASAASAGPIPRPDLGASVPALTETVQGWRYHRNCGWHNGRWVVDLGGGRVILCRPYRPGRDWRWHSEGNRHGWYNERRRAWHYDRW